MIRFFMLSQCDCKAQGVFALSSLNRDDDDDQDDCEDHGGEDHEDDDHEGT